MRAGTGWHRDPRFFLKREHHEDAFDLARENFGQDTSQRR